MPRHSMQKRHFNALADAIVAVRRDLDHSAVLSDEECAGAMLALDKVSERIADVCETFNPEFWRDHFLKESSSEKAFGG